MNRVLTNSNFFRYLGVPLLLAGWLSAVPVHATDVYHWIDANGVQNYSERPPEGIEYTKLKLGSSPTKKPSSLPPPSPLKPSTQAKDKNKNKNTAKKATP